MLKRFQKVDVGAMFHYSSQTSQQKNFCHCVLRLEESYSLISNVFLFLTLESNTI